MENLLAQIGLIVNKYEEIEKVNATNFNIFSILKLERNEVETHSYFIYELLNPQGTHNQGDVFVKLFITTVLGLDINDDSAIKVKREDLTSNNRRIDFTIQTLKYQIGIEMKIDAQDQDEQLNDYLIELNERAVNSQEVKLYYLTLFGYKASKSSVKGLKLNKDYYAISFSVDILNWLEKCIEKSATIPILREGLVQYKNLINKITNKSQTKGITMEIKNLLMNPKNLKLFSTAQEAMQEVKIEIQINFWKKLKEELNKNNLDFKFTTDNINKSVQKYYTNKKDNKFYGLYLTLDTIKNYNIRFEIEIWENIYYGFTAYNLKNEDWGYCNHDELSNKKQIVNNLDIKWEKNNNDWFGWKFTPQKLNFHEFNDEIMFSLANEDYLDNIVANISKEIFQLISAYKNN
jgi:hypothetical protein